MLRFFFVIGTLYVDVLHCFLELIKIEIIDDGHKNIDKEIKLTYQDYMRLFTRFNIYFVYLILMPAIV